MFKSILSNLKAQAGLMFEVLITPDIGVLPALKGALISPVNTVAGAIIGTLHVCVLLTLLFVTIILLSILPFYSVIQTIFNRMKNR